jgi:hypothetical protein
MPYLLSEPPVSASSRLTSTPSHFAREEPQDPFSARPILISVFGKKRLQSPTGKLIANRVSAIVRPIIEGKVTRISVEHGRDSPDSVRLNRIEL